MHEGHIKRTLGNGSSRVLSFSSSDTNQLSSEVRKSGIDHDGPKAEELAQGARMVEFSKGTRMVPVSEAWGIAVRTASAGNDQGENNDADDDDDFEGGKPKFQFAEELDS